MQEGAGVFEERFRALFTLNINLKEKKQVFECFFNIINYKDFVFRQIKNIV